MQNTKQKAEALRLLLFIALTVKSYGLVRRGQANC